MSAYQSPTRAIRDGLVSILSAMTYDAGLGTEPAFALATADPRAQTNQDPYCIVWNVGGTEAQEGVGYDDRTSKFVVSIVLQLEGANRTQIQTADYMTTLVDLTISTLAVADFTDALSGYEQTVHSYIVQPGEFKTDIYESKAGALLITEINISVRWQYNLY